MSTVGRRIASARIEAGFTQAELADQIGITEGSVRQYEAGSINPRPNKLRRIAEVTGKSLAWLRGEDDDVAPEHGTIHIGDAVIEGPAEVLAKVLAAHQATSTPDGAPEAHTGATRTTAAEHTAIHRILDLHEQGKLKEELGIELTAYMVEMLRGVQFRGAPVTDIRQAIDLALMFQQWEIDEKLGRR